MKNTATIRDAKVTASDRNYGAVAHTKLTITLDIDLPAPEAVLSIEEWAARELSYSDRQKLAERRASKDAKPPTKAEKKQMQKAHEERSECDVQSCRECYNIDAESMPCIHGVAVYDCPKCDDESALLLTDDERDELTGHWQTYRDERNTRNRAALEAAQEAALYLMLIKRPVFVQLSPAQEGFRELLQLT